MELHCNEKLFIIGHRYQLNIEERLHENADEGDEDLDEAERSVAEKLDLLQKWTPKKCLKQEQDLSCDVKKCGTVENRRELSEKVGSWYKVDDMMLVYDSEGLHHSYRVAAFDLDGTIITTKSGRTFATDCNDWKILYTEVPGKLKKLNSEGYKLVLITNQLGIGKGKVKEEDFKEKIQSIINLISVPIQVLAIIKRGRYRKPNVGAIEWLRDVGNGQVPLSLTGDDFFYVGDAAGRDKGWATGKKKDFSCSDRLLAINAGCRFFTPEEYFLSYKAAKFCMPAFDPRNVLDHAPLIKHTKNNSCYKQATDNGQISSAQQELIILCGYPACGKTSFAKRHLARKGYVLINRDKLKTWQKCVEACHLALGSGRSCVVDNTNPDIESRKRYVSCAVKHKCKCRCFLFDVSIEHAFHNNRFRELFETVTEHDRVPPMVFYSHRKKYVEPTLAEGFDQIVTLNFVPSFDDDQARRDAYRMFLD